MFEIRRLKVQIQAFKISNIQTFEDPKYCLQTGSSGTFGTSGSSGSSGTGTLSFLFRKRPQAFSEERVL